MFKNLLRSMTTIVCLLVLIALSIIIIWQQDRTEAKQIQLLKNSKKNHVNIHNFLERKMDKVFINFLKNNIEDGRSFIKLASNLNGNEFQSFMMGESNLLTKLKIINSMPKLPFIKELFK